MADDQLPTRPLTDLIGLDPDYTDGLSVADHIARQRCGRDHLDEEAVRADERGKVAEEIAQRLEAGSDIGNPDLYTEDQDFAAAAHIAREIGHRRG